MAMETKFNYRQEENNKKKRVSVQEQYMNEQKMNTRIKRANIPRKRKLRERVRRPYKMFVMLHKESAHKVLVQISVCAF